MVMMNNKHVIVIWCWPLSKTLFRRSWGWLRTEPGSSSGLWPHRTLWSSHSAGSTPIGMKHWHVEVSTQTSTNCEACDIHVEILPFMGELWGLLNRYKLQGCLVAYPSIVPPSPRCRGGQIRVNHSNPPGHGIVANLHTRTHMRGSLHPKNSISSSRASHACLLVRRPWIHSERGEAVFFPQLKGPFHL